MKTLNELLALPLCRDEGAVELVQGNCLGFTDLALSSVPADDLDEHSSAPADDIDDHSSATADDPDDETPDESCKFL